MPKNSLTTEKNKSLPGTSSPASGFGADGWLLLSIPINYEELRSAVESNLAEYRKYLENMIRGMEKRN
jgi:hypothetical protein